MDKREKTYGIWALVLVCIAGFMTALDALVVATALPSIQRELQASVSSLSWTVNAFELTLAAGILPAATIGDRYGRRRLFVIGLALFTLASAACAVAPSITVLIAARAAQGLGAAIVSPLSLTLLASAFPAERRGTVVGIWAGVAGLAIAGGPLVGGALTQSLTWHSIFWLNVPVGLVVAVLARLRLRESRGLAKSFDLPAVALITLAAFALTWALIRGNDAGWMSSEILGTFALGIAALIGFVVREMTTSEPLLPMRLFRNRAFSAANASAFLMTASLIPSAFLTSQYLQLVLGNSPFGAGLRYLPMTATPLVVAPLAGMFADRIGHRPVMALGLALQATGLAAFAALASVGVNYLVLVLPLVVAGVGVSMPFATTAAAALSAVAPHDMGKASGAANTIRNFGGAFGIAIATAVFTANGHIGTPATFDAGFRPALVVAAALAAVGALAALAVRHPSLPVPAKRRGDVLSTLPAPAATAE